LAALRPFQHSSESFLFFCLDILLEGREAAKMSNMYFFNLKEFFEQNRNIQTTFEIFDCVADFV